MNSLKRIVFRSMILGIGLCAPIMGAQAASFEVNPVGLTLSANHTTGVLAVTNNGDATTVIQLQAVAWSQDEGKDAFLPTRELLATPPIFTVNPGAQQLVRVGLRVAPAARQETSYRLFLTEVPPPPAAGFRGLQIALRISIPIFVTPAVPTAAELEWQIRRLDPHTAKLTAINNGNAHAHIASIELRARGSNALMAHQDGVGYVLPGKSHSWTLTLSKLLPPGAQLELSATTDKGTVHVQLVLK